MGTGRLKHPQDYRVVGCPAERLDIIRKVTEYSLECASFPELLKIDFILLVVKPKLIADPLYKFYCK